jgi:hypothetical protein
MKLLKYILVLFITASITSCSDSEEAPPFLLSNANLAGTYNINSLSIDTKVTSETDVSGISVPFTIATSTSIGDTFQVAFVLNANSSYTASGQYRIVSIITPAVGSTVTNTEIIDFSDSGSFQLNTTNNTITFNSSTGGDFIEGTLDIETFNETTIAFSQEIEEIIDEITTEIKANISFTRQ